MGVRVPLLAPSVRYFTLAAPQRPALDVTTVPASSSPRRRRAEVGHALGIGADDHVVQLPAVAGFSARRILPPWSEPAGRRTPGRVPIDNPRSAGRDLQPRPLAGTGRLAAAVGQRRLGRSLLTDTQRDDLVR